jgi:selenocysteine-specific translation elongation factor
VTHRWLDVLQQSADCRPIFVGTKLDLTCPDTLPQVRQSCEDEKFSPYIFTSAVSGEGIPELKTALTELATDVTRSEQRPSTVVRLQDSRPSSGQKEKKWIRRC